MSIVFEALKKAKGQQAEKLFETNKKGAEINIVKQRNLVPVETETAPLNATSASTLTPVPPTLTSTLSSVPAPANAPVLSPAPVLSSLSAPLPILEPANNKIDHNIIEEKVLKPVEVLKPTEDRPAKSASVTPLPKQLRTVNTDSKKHPQVTLKAGESKLLLLNDNPAASEQFSLLRARVLAAAKKHDIRTICVTSSVAGEGKTFVAANLALALAAESEKGVVLVDGYLRKPGLYQMLGVPDTTGLADFIQSNRNDIDSVIIDTDRQFSFIPAGRIPANPLALINSEKMGWFISELRKRYDFVIIDTPPTAPLADTDSLASLADGVVLVIEAAKTPMKIIQRTVKMLNKHKIIGSVLNGIKEVPSLQY